MANQVVGTLRAISPVESLSARSGQVYSKQSILLDAGGYDPDTGEKRENDLMLDFINHREGNIRDRFHAGDRVAVSFRLRGRQYEKDGRRQYAVGVNCFRIEAYNPAGTAAPQGQTPRPAAQPPVATATTEAAPAENDLPW